MSRTRIIKVYLLNDRPAQNINNVLIDSDKSSRGFESVMP